eukprot:CAMPEP_0113298284 /NCGR_PEP_ID=MMETSP0010_2-20120614/794_1 /TAXON_ID=216773 ORGANISM="Corethron hystrix, Strain 308" /NCGR_SAMPLE_ID=MMETSP0010_2 /ASSEMBLY_ACC=CAM_ASM_000155 /LENGTH=61 /DNA_ID=CAMNT_0000151315 /DNA_START=206 /DNA_END=392 /DNA_ORIENTATION=+ /assembly_acc=CAM_ASM_000155
MGRVGSGGEDGGNLGGCGGDMMGPIAAAVAGGAMPLESVTKEASGEETLQLPALPGVEGSV